MGRAKLRGYAFRSRVFHGNRLFRASIFSRLSDLAFSHALMRDDRKLLCSQEFGSLIEFRITKAWRS